MTIFGQAESINTFHPVSDPQPLTGDPPQTWPEVGVWAKASFSGRLALTGSALRSMKKAVYQDIDKVTKSLCWLADTCRQHWISGKAQSMAETIDSGLRNAHCGSDRYDVIWLGVRRFVDWHIKSGGNSRSPERCLRIYYFWDAAAGLIVVDHLPSHRPSNLS